MAERVPAPSPSRGAHRRDLGRVRDRVRLRARVRVGVGVGVRVGVWVGVRARVRVSVRVRVSDRVRAMVRLQAIGLGPWLGCRCDLGHRLLDVEGGHHLR